MLKARKAAIMERMGADHISFRLTKESPIEQYFWQQFLLEFRMYLFRQIIRAMRRRVSGTTRITIVNMDCCFSTTTRREALFWSGLVALSNYSLTKLSFIVSSNASSA